MSFLVSLTDCVMVMRPLLLPFLPQSSNLVLPFTNSHMQIVNPFLEFVESLVARNEIKLLVECSVLLH